MLRPVFGLMGSLWHGLALSTYPTDSGGGAGDRGESGVGLPFSLMKRGCCLFRQGAGERVRDAKRGSGSGRHVKGGRHVKEGRQVKGGLKKAGESEGGAMCPPVSLHAASPAAIPVAPRLVASCAFLRLPVQSGVVWHCRGRPGPTSFPVVRGLSALTGASRLPRTAPVSALVRLWGRPATSSAHPPHAPPSRPSAVTRLPALTRQAAGSPTADDGTCHAGWVRRHRHGTS